MSTLPEIVAQRAREQGSEVAYRFFQGAALEPQVLTFHGLWQRAAALACLLQQQGLQGSRALLVCKSQQQFVTAFYACLLAGVVAVPTSPPRRQNLAGRLRLLLDDADLGAILSDDGALDPAELAGMTVAQIDLRSCLQDADLDGLAARWRMPALAPSDAAFLQYTSGSTSAPKGVVVTHANLIDNCSIIREAMDFSPAASIFTALPLFHDMGLVGGILESMFAGCSGNCMAPAEFVQYPERWLQIMSAYRISISGGPNFMYELAARAVTDEQLAGVDLSSWKVAFCGAEPIRASTVERFTSRFAAAGFRADAFYPCYGMAEATLFISGKRLGALPQVSASSGSAVVCCGVPRGDMQVEIVDPASGVALAPGQTGEIWVSGASVAAGYWRRPELSAATFQATIGSRPGTCFLRTGDLGYLEDGQLYVTGRLKDLIIVYGKKYAPQDIEQTAAAAHDALREDCGAAFCIHHDGSERLVLAFELRREAMRRHEQWPQVLQAVRSAVADAHGVRVDDLVLLKTGALPRTSSGKVRRAQCQADYLAATLERAVPLERAPQPA